jgi:iron complex outermembrane receptor protein
VANHLAVPTETPRHKAFAFGEWTPLEGLRVMPSLELGGKRWLQSYLNSSYYYRGADYALVNLKAAYEIRKGLEVEVGANNLTNQNYVVEDGYNGQGRNFFTNVRVQF